MRIWNAIPNGSRQRLWQTACMALSTWFPDAANKKSEQSEPCSDWRRWRDLNPRAGFLRRPPGFQDRSLQPLGYISKCISAPTFLGKKERNLERNPDFLLISCRRNPLKTQGKLKNGFQNTLPFSRPPRYVRFGNSPWRAERLHAQKSYHKSPVLSIEKRRCTTIFGRKGLHKGHFMI